MLLWPHRPITPAHLVKSPTPHPPPTHPPRPPNPRAPDPLSSGTDFSLAFKSICHGYLKSIYGTRHPCRNYIFTYKMIHGKEIDGSMSRCLNRRTRYGTDGMHYHILLRQYSQNYYTYNNVVKNIYSRCHKDACVQISTGNIEWLLRYKGVSSTCFSGDNVCFHRERWLGETPLGPRSRPRIL